VNIRKISAYKRILAIVLTNLRDNFKRNSIKLLIFDTIKHNTAMMKSLQSPHVVQLVGICGDAIMTEYHPNGTLGDLIESETYQNFTLLDRIKLAIRYVEILSYLHNSPGTF